MLLTRSNSTDGKPIYVPTVSPPTSSVQPSDPVTSHLLLAPSPTQHPNLPRAPRPFRTSGTRRHHHSLLLPLHSDSFRERSYLGRRAPGTISDHDIVDPILRVRSPGRPTSPLFLCPRAPAGQVCACALPCSSDGGLSVAEVRCAGSKGSCVEERGRAGGGLFRRSDVELRRRWECGGRSGLGESLW